VPNDQPEALTETGDRTVQDKCHGCGRQTLGAKWGEIDLSSPPPIALPVPGEYEGIIASVRLFDKSDTLWMAVSYQLAGHTAAPDDELVVIAVRDGSPYRTRLVEGRRLLNRIADATLVDLSSVQNLFDLPDELNGRSLLIRVKHRIRDGIPSLAVQGLRPIS
jgi:hypothetical protein